MEHRIDPNIASSFAKQQFMSTLGARLIHAHDGCAKIELVPRPELTQQHGFVHAGAVASIGDSACGYAAMSLAPEGRGVLTVEFKITLLEPAIGERFVAEGRVIRPGRKLFFAEAGVYAYRSEGEPVQIARVSATIATVDESRLP